MIVAQTWNKAGFLKSLGFIDMGGSAVVHMTAGVAGLIGAYNLGPRIAIYSSRYQYNTVNENPRLTYRSVVQYLSSDTVRMNQFIENYQ